MRFLKKVTCRYTYIELQQAHQEIKNYPHLYMNTTFKLIDDHVFPFGENTNLFSYKNVLEDVNANNDIDDEEMEWW